MQSLATLLSLNKKFLTPQIAALIAIVCIGAAPSRAHAIDPGAFLIGTTYLSHGLGRVATEASGATSQLGTPYWNFFFQARFALSQSYFIAPELIWMPDFGSPRKAAGDSAATSFMILGLPLVMNLSEHISVNGGVALVDYQIKGAGGVQALNNGNGTSDFALPGRTEKARTGALIFGVSFDFRTGKLGLDAMVESPFAESKKTMSAMLTLAFTAFHL